MQLDISQNYKPGTYHLLTYGCQMNEYDSEIISMMMDELKCLPVDKPQAADIIIFNTCCVRENADLKVYGKIGQYKELKRINPRLILAVCGCLAQKDGEKLIKNHPHLDLVVGTYNLKNLKELINEVWENRVPLVKVGRTDARLELPANRKGRISAWLPISVGCDCFCSFCIVPYVRGRQKSRTAANIIKEAEALAAAGYKEITLLGQNVNRYGFDLEPPSNFGELLQNLDSIKGIKRIRFMSPHPADFSDSLIEVMAGMKKLCSHVHLPLQSADDEILKRMKRGYISADYRLIVEKLREVMLDIAITTDIIVGFPGETMEQFENTLNFIREVKFDSAFMFAYSKRAGTSASLFKDQLDEEEKLTRLHKLIAVQNEVTMQKNQETVGEIKEVLVEGWSKKNPGRLTGHTSGRKVVVFEGEESLIGEFVDVKLTKGYTWGFIGEL